MDAEKVTSELNVKFNLASLVEKIDEGFSYFSVLERDCYKLDVMEWQQSHDQKRTESAYLMIPRSSFVFDGELCAVVFKNAALAKSFVINTSMAQKDVGVLKMDKISDGIVFSQA